MTEILKSLRWYKQKLKAATTHRLEPIKRMTGYRAEQWARVVQIDEMEGLFGEAANCKS